MSRTLQQVITLVAQGEVRISVHGYDELAADGIFAREVIAGVVAAVVVEDYPDYHKGPAVLVLQRTGEGEPIHTVWGLPAGAQSPAVLVTAYRPDPEQWSDDFTRRRT
jgi:hypothetical protein